MADFLEAFRPLLRGIEEYNWQRANFNIPTGDRAHWKPDHAGWLIDWALVTMNPNVIVEHNFWGQKISYSPAQFYAATTDSTFYVVPNPAYNWFSKWDIMNSIYSMLYTPRPYDYFTDDMYIDVINDTGLPAQILGLNVHYLDLIHPEEYIKSVKEIYGSKMP